MPINTGSKGGDGAFGKGRKKRARTIPTPPTGLRRADKIFQPPLQEKPGFSLGTYEVLEEFDDYLVCRGYDPNAKHPFAEVTPDAQRTIKVAKPPLLQKTPWDGVDPVTIGGVEYTYSYSTSEMGVRTATWTDDDGAHSEEQRIDPPYFVGDLLLCAEVSISPVVKGMEVNGTKAKDENGAILTWVDKNFGGRHWGGAGACPAQNAIIDITIIGSPTGGTFDIALTVNGTAATLTFDYNDDSAAVKTVLETHAEIATGDVQVTNGPFPDSTMRIEFQGDLANQNIDLPTLDWSALTGGSGVAGIAALAQRGASG